MVQAKLAEIATGVNDTSGVQTYSEADGVYYLDEVRIHVVAAGDEGNAPEFIAGVAKSGNSPSDEGDMYKNPTLSTSVTDTVGNVIIINFDDYVHFSQEEIFVDIVEDDAGTMDIYAVIRGGNI